MMMVREKEREAQETFCREEGGRQREREEESKKQSLRVRPDTPSASSSSLRMELMSVL